MQLNKFFTTLLQKIQKCFQSSENGDYLDNHVLKFIIAHIPLSLTSLSKGILVRGPPLTVYHIQWTRDTTHFCSITFDIHCLIFIRLGTSVHHNKLKCHINDPDLYVKGQGHRPRSNGKFFSQCISFTPFI